MTMRLDKWISPELRIVLGVLGIVCLLYVAGYGLILYLFRPQLVVFYDHNFASNYSRVFSQLKAEDLAALDIPMPLKNSPLSHTDALRILQRLHDTKRFPEWNPAFKLVDSQGKPLEFFIRQREKENPTAATSSGNALKSGDYIVSIKVSTSANAIESL